ncbi:glycosyltransferase family 4 protein [Candidatus Gottesmanbacteria bacterium]|nr:glycosyltransferase family 4 protein [Candidatus Gottesmanbacteria bacterium]
MKVLFLLTYYYPYWSGLSQYAKRLAEGLAREGIDVSVLTTQHVKGLPLSETINGVRVERKPYLFRLSRTLISFRLLFFLFKAIGDSDVIFVYLPYSEVLLASIISKILSKKIYLVHNADMELPKGFLNRIIDSIFYTTTSWAISLSTKTIIYTKDYAEHSLLLKKKRTKWLEILPLFVIPKVTPSEVEVFRKRNQLLGKVCIGFSGRFVEEKGVDILLAAIPHILKKIPNAYFVFAGDYKLPYENFYEVNREQIERYDRNITFLGLIEDQKTLSKFYSVCECLVLPSRKECLGSVQVEAMLCGTPVVATDIPGARQIVKKTGMGLLAKPNNPESLALSIIEVVKGKERFKRLRSEIESYFDYDKTLRHYLTLLRRDKILL